MSFDIRIFFLFFIGFLAVSGAADAQEGEAQAKDMAFREAFAVIQQSRALLQKETGSKAWIALNGRHVARRTGYVLRPERSRASFDDITSPLLLVSGHAEVLDGQRLSVQGHVIRLHGVQAPDAETLCRNEAGDAYDCAAWSREVLQHVVSENSVFCHIGERQDGDDTPGICYRRDAAGSRDLAEWLLFAGSVLVTSEGETLYGAASRDARDAKRGLWSGSFTDFSGSR